MEKLTMADVLDRAKARLELPSDSQLARHLGITRQRLSTWRDATRLSLPRPEVMTKLTDAAGLTDLVSRKIRAQDQ